MFNEMSGIEGGGEDTVAWGNLTPTPDLCFWNDKKFSCVFKKNSNIF